MANGSLFLYTCRKDYYIYPMANTYYNTYNKYCNKYEEGRKQ